jgi:hypothetical protein
MQIGPDTNSWKVGFNYPLARAQGCTVTYVKLGGNNLAGNVPYYSDSYPGFVDNARAAGYRVGHYWLTGGSSPEASAQFFTARIRNRQASDFYVLDNEALDSGRRWTDSESARFFRVVGDAFGYGNLFLYGARDNDLGRHTWPETLALGVKVISANFNNRPLVNYVPATIPASAVKGHQYTSSASVGGMTNIDMNAFTDDAFVGSSVPTGGNATPLKKKGNRMFLDWDTGGTGYLTTEDGVLPLTSPTVYNLFFRKINSDQLLTPFAVPQVPGAKSGRPDTFLKAEQDIVNANLRILASSVQTSIPLDPAKLASAVADAIGGKLDVTVESDLSEEDLAKLSAAYEAAATRIGAALVKQAGAALSNG